MHLRNDTKSRRIPLKSLDSNAGMSLSSSGNKSNFLRERSHNTTETRHYTTKPAVGTAKFFTMSDIDESIKKFAEYKVVLAPIGKTAEVKRGLYSTCSSLQFFDLSGCEIARIHRASRIIQAASKYTSANHDFTDFQSDFGKGVITPFGIIYTELTDQKGNFDYVSDQDFDKEGLLPIRRNFEWWAGSGFYDSEMKKGNHYATVVDFVVQIGGNNQDVVATSALLDFAEKKSSTALESLEKKLACVANPHPYQAFIEEIKSVAKL